jgi:uncharacterized DUF497 family protein
LIEERQIQLEWLERTLAKPGLIEPDAADSALESRFAKIPEFGDRVLRVVVNTQVVPERVVSVYFDRKMKGRL